ncbi:MAG: sugar phosphate nucleotidyltransferase [bacterium]
MEALHGAVLAAGEGTRLAPLTRYCPKPLVPLAGRPLLAAALDALRAAGVDRIGINAFHLGGQVAAAFADDPAITVVTEATLQGTGGGVRGIAAALPQGPLVVINGDALFDFPLAPLIARHRAAGALGTLVLREVPPDAPFGRVGIDPTGRLHRIAEVEGPDAASFPLQFGAFTGVQIIEPALIAALPPGPGDILRTAWKALLARRRPLQGVFVEPWRGWFDVGTPDRYLAAHRAILAGDLAAPHLPPADALGRRLHPDARVHPDARLEGPCAVLAGARIGPAARVGAFSFVDTGARVDGALEDAVVWPGVHVPGALAHAIALPGEIVQLPAATRRAPPAS